MPKEQAESLLYDWRFWARPNQLPPEGNWRVWLILAGRGFGKTRSGAEFVIDQVAEGNAQHVALIGETAGDVRDVMVEGGESSILKISPPWFYPKYEPSKRRLTWPNGATANTYSGDEPDQLRGPQHDLAWADEPAKWKYAAETWDNMEFGLRLGTHPRCVATTTPRPIPLILDLLKDPDVVVTKGSTFENIHNLAPSFIKRVVRKYEGTRLGRQELHAEVLTDVPGALWTRDLIEATRVREHPQLVRIVTAVDPEAASDEDSAETGIVVAGLGVDGHGYVLDDCSIRGTPHEWATQAVAAYNKHRCDRLVGEVNNGGDMVEYTVRTIMPRVAFKKLHASRGKVARAEPVSAIYEQGQAHHVGMFAQLEDQMCNWVPPMSSPDRMDALVWAITELMLSPKQTFLGAAAVGAERPMR